MPVVPNMDEWEMLEIGLGLTQSITHNPWPMDHPHEFKFKLIDLGMSCQDQ